jgi:hypothetical protein
MPHELADSVKRRAITLLAANSKLPFDQVAQLYEVERAKLEVSARVKLYLPIFTFRNVREQLLLMRPP